MSSGALIPLGDLRVQVWDSPVLGALVYDETFTGAIVNGSWNVMLGEGVPLALSYGVTYYKDYRINGVDLNFTNTTGGNVDRLAFISSLGPVGASMLTGVASQPAIDGSNITSGVIANARYNTSYVLVSSLPQDSNITQIWGNLTSHGVRIAALEVATGVVNPFWLLSSGKITSNSSMADGNVHVSGNLTSGTSTASAIYTVAFGSNNQASNQYSSVLGGKDNSVGGQLSAVCGGYLNSVSGYYSTICGGSTNTVNGQYSTIPGGYGNYVMGDYSLAAGNQTRASSPLSFAFGSDFTNDQPYSFMVGFGAPILIVNVSGAYVNGLLVNTGTGAVTTTAGSSWLDDGSAIASNSSINGGNVKVTGTLTAAEASIGTILQLTPIATAPSCNTASEGSIYSNVGLHLPCYCNGTNWYRMDDFATVCT